MLVQNPARPGALMQVIDILGDQRKTLTEEPLEPHQRPVPFVRLNRSQLGPPGIVKIVDPGWVRRESFRRRHLLDGILLPETATVAKGADAALSADTGTRYHGHPAALAGGRENSLCCVFHEESLGAPGGFSKALEKNTYSPGPASPPASGP